MFVFVSFCFVSFCFVLFCFFTAWSRVPSKGHNPHLTSIFSEISGSYERQALLQVVPEGLLIHTGTAIRSSRAAVQSRSLNRTFFFFFFDFQRCRRLDSSNVTSVYTVPVCLIIFILLYVLNLGRDQYLALINRARSLYWRILTKIVSRDQTPRGLYTPQRVQNFPYRPTKLG